MEPLLPRVQLAKKDPPNTTTSLSLSFTSKPLSLISLSLADDGGGPDLHPLQQLAYGKPVVGSSPTPLSGFRSTGRRAPCLVPLSGSSSGSPGAQAGGGHLASSPSQAQNQGMIWCSHSPCLSFFYGFLRSGTFHVGVHLIYTLIVCPSELLLHALNPSQLLPRFSSKLWILLKGR